jgi:hypothetical protein
VCVSTRLFAQFSLRFCLSISPLSFSHTHTHTDTLPPGIPIPASGPIEWIQVSIGARQNGEWSRCPCRGHDWDAALLGSKATWRLADTMVKMHSPHRNRKKKSSCSCGLVSVSPKFLATGGNDKDSVGAHTHPSTSRQTSARIVSILVAHHARQKNSPGDKIEEWERRNIVSGSRNAPRRRRDDRLGGDSELRRTLREMASVNLQNIQTNGRPQKCTVKIRVCQGGSLFFNLVRYRKAHVNTIVTNANFG